MRVCNLCPTFFRLAEACPRQPELLLEFPSAIQSEELYTGVQIAELKEMEIPFHTFRENLLLNENMQPIVMNIILYSTWVYEVLMVFTSLVAATLPFALLFALLVTRKPGFCRALIVYMVAKIFFYMWGNSTSFQFANEKFYICSSQISLAEPKLVENLGLCEQCFLVSVFFTYLVMSTLMSMNNCLCKNILQRMNFSFYGMMVGAGFLFALFLSKLHLL